MFSVTSRYQGIPTATHVLPDGRTVVYVRRRFVPHPEDMAQIGEHVVAPGERLDQVAAAEFGDPEQAWRIADANRAMDPEELTTTPGRRLRVTLPPGLPQGGTLGAALGGGPGIAFSAPPGGTGHA
jgi:hypothetical protein